MEKQSIIKSNTQSSIEIKRDILKNARFLKIVSETTTTIIQSLKIGGKILFCGNGGSAADAQHLAAELSGRYYFDRPPLNAEALHVNTSYLTAVANDYSYEEIYSRLIEGTGKHNDVLIGLSTSGNSKNVVKAFETAKKMGIITIGFTGRSGGKLQQFSDYCLKIPSEDTPRIQECHMLIGHSICEQIESEFFKKSK